MNDGDLLPVAGLDVQVLAAVVQDSVEVLPGDEYRFMGLSERTAQLVERVKERNREVSRAMTAQSSVWEVAAKVTWSRGFGSLKGYTVRLALAETASHMTYLRQST